VQALDERETEEERAHLCLKIPAADNLTLLQLAAYSGLPLVVSKRIQVGASVDLKTRGDCYFTPLDMLERRIAKGDSFWTPLGRHFADMVRSISRQKWRF
jgi:hypothetical protein